jgi:hypothetical protein
VVVDIESRYNKHVNGNTTPKSSEDIEDCEVIGIIMLKDVFEELLHVNSMCILGTVPRSSLCFHQHSFGFCYLLCYLTFIFF